MKVRHARPLILLAALASAACKRSFTQQDALVAIQHHETIQRLLAPDSERVAHETVQDCRAMYDDDPAVARAAGDSAWILLSSAGWMDLADVDAPSDAKRKKHCRAILTAKADKAAFNEPRELTESPWTSYWTVETAHTTAEVVNIPEDSTTRELAVADFEIRQERTPIGGILHRPKWSDESAHLFATTLTGHFRHTDEGWRLESFDEKK
jgi:RES domain-containing protein